MKCVLGQKYQAPDGSEFIPVEFEKGKRKLIDGGSWQHRKEGVYIDADGRRFKKSKIKPLTY